ncbi:hypothetical protein F8144_37925 [Streptomyces triticiradicis]|uniref:Uncharacterized protein n=1 Tax=Streptomyces triticiradicis TaxID=2651189 RepID=A0A7J5D488_9ACTN|nr:hypothetical protein F8144_37925 [Streptomyces triticiradicis]
MPEISGNHTSSSRPERAAGTRTYIVRAPSLPTTTRSAAVYRGSRTRSCSTAAPAIHSATRDQSSARRRTPA